MERVRESGLFESGQQRIQLLKWSLSVFRETLRNICEHMYAKHYMKGHDEQHLAATSRNILFFVGEIEITTRELNYKTEKK